MFEKTGYQDFNRYGFEATRSSYERFAREYGERWEWSSKTYGEIISFNILPFSEYCTPGGKVLIAGSGTGRDFKILSEKGFSCIGIDYSRSMVEEARRRVGGVFVHADIREIDLGVAEFDGVYCESALTHLSLDDVSKVLSKFFRAMTSNGALYIAVKIGDPGIYVTSDIGGPRYFNVFDKNSFTNLLKEKDLEIKYSAISEHTDEFRPKWLSIVAKKNQ